MKRHSLYFHEDHWKIFRQEADIRGVSISRLLLMVFNQWRTSYVSLPPQTQSRLITQAKLRFDGGIDKLIHHALDCLEAQDP